MTMTKGEKNLLHSYMDSSTHYLEFGAGESTVYAAKSPMIKTIDSVESSPKYVDENLRPNENIVMALAANRLCFHIIDIGETIAWGRPKDRAKRHLWPSYSASVFSKNEQFDLVLVDGRFRVACTLNSILNTTDDCVIMIHDFWNRPEYHVVLRYLETRDKVDTLGVFSKKRHINLAEVESLIKKYQYLPNDKTLLFQLKKHLTQRFSGHPHKSTQK